MRENRQSITPRQARLLLPWLSVHAQSWLGVPPIINNIRAEPSSPYRLQLTSDGSTSRGSHGGTDASSASVSPAQCATDWRDAGRRVVRCRGRSRDGGPRLRREEDVRRSRRP